MRAQTEKDDRAEVLGRVRKSLQSALLPSSRPSIPPRPASTGVSPSDLVEQFTREIEALGMLVHTPSTEADANEKVFELVRPDAPADSGANLEILAWGESEIPLRGLSGALDAAGIIRLDAELPADPAARRARLAALGNAAVGLTGTQAALADTGSLVLLSGPKRPRLASLLPPVHIAIVSKREIYATMADYFSAHPSAVREGSNLVFITGPSRTADIEQTLTLGVHGPRTVHVVLVD